MAGDRFRTKEVWAAALTADSMPLKDNALPETVTRAADGAIVPDATFTQTDDSGKQLAKVQETVRLPSPETPTDMVRYARALKLVNGAVLLHITTRDQATNRVGSIAIPIGKQ